MNFAQMLAMSANAQPRAADKSWTRNTHDASVVRQSKTLQKYTAAIGCDWRSTAAIAERLGMERTSMFKQLGKYMSLGVIERRPLNGKPYNHHAGWEWRMAKNG
jgi:transcriptional regulator of acetoin/glycerol metabolism